MHAYVLLRTPDGKTHELVHGELVGRVWTAALQLDDGRVSEAHAMVSLRDGELQLLSLRGVLAVDGQPVRQVTLRPGLRVELARGVDLEVMEVNLPDHVLGVEGPGLLRQVLPGVCSILLEGPPDRRSVRLTRGWREDAAAQAWTTGDHWLAKPLGEPARPITVGDTLQIGPCTLRFVEVGLGEGAPRTTRRPGELEAPLNIVASYDTVHVHRPGVPVFFLGGMQARLVSELVALGGPVSWSVLSEELWPEEPDAQVRRGRLDTLISRLRRRLRAAGVRADLLQTDGSGKVELLVYPHDTVEDRT
jgi:hypothetical protein